jgi:DNA-binding response OmpR family regulator
MIAQEISPTLATVLVVEDEPVVCSLLKEFLVQLNLSGRFAANGVEAIALIEARPPDLVLLDINLPRMGGVEVLRWARRRWPAGYPFGVLVLTGVKDEPLLQEALKLGAADVLLKPVSMEVLELSVRVQLAVRPGAPVSHPSNVASPQRILILDENQHTRSVMKRALENDGYTVLEAKDSDEAIRLCHEGGRPIHLLIADVLVADPNGLQISHLVKAQWPETKILLCSREYKQLRSLLRFNEDTPFLTKPFDTQTLILRVRQLLHSNRAR